MGKQVIDDLIILIVFQYPWAIYMIYFSK